MNSKTGAEKEGGTGMNGDRELREKYGCCEACGDKQTVGVQYKLFCVYSGVVYKLCSIHLIKIVSHSLSRQEWDNIVLCGHEENEFLLHEDFYEWGG